MDRRDLFAAAGAAVTLASAGAALAQEQGDPSGHAAGHHQHAAQGGKHQELAAEMSHCVVTGQACLAHCLETFAAGDTTLAACAKSVREMVAATAALQELATSNSPHVPAMARVVQGVCVDCERECRKHAPHHEICRTTADSCLQGAAACERAASA